MHRLRGEEGVEGAGVHRQASDASGVLRNKLHVDRATPRWLIESDWQTTPLTVERWGVGTAIFCVGTKYCAFRAQRLGASVQLNAASVLCSEGGGIFSYFKAIHFSGLLGSSRRGEMVHPLSGKGVGVIKGKDGSKQRTGKGLFSSPGSQYPAPIAAEPHTRSKSISESSSDDAPSSRQNMVVCAEVIRLDSKTTWFENL